MNQRFKAEIFCEANGKPSMGRVLTLVLVAFVIGWNTASLILAWRFNFMHPDHVISVFPDGITLGAQGVFMTLFYGVNKAAGTYESVKSAAVAAVVPPSIPPAAPPAQ